MSGYICLLAIFSLSILSSSGDCKKTVVFFPVMITSHTRLYGMVAEEVAKYGHNVWLFVPSAFSKRKADVFSGINVVNYTDYMDDPEESIVSRLETTALSAEPDWNWALNYEDILADLIFQALRKGDIIEFVKNLKPDLIVLDTFPRVNELVALPYKLEVPFALLGCLQFPVHLRIPYNPLADLYDSKNFQASGLPAQIFAVLHFMYTNYRNVFSDRGYIKQIVPEKPDIATNELMSKAEVYVLENDPIFDYARPMLPYVKYVGGISAGPAKNLMEPFKSFIDRSEKDGIGVAVFSLGTLIMNLSPDKEMKFKTALKRIKFNTILRANFTSPEPSKILTSTWIPVNDILAHRNTKVFISHCGIHSQYEALYHAVPLVCIPLFYDQPFNAERAEVKGFGRTVDFTHFTVEELVQVIQEVAANEDIRSTVKRASEIYHQLYKDPKKTSAFWLDHVMKYGGEYMRYSGQKMSSFMFLVPDLFLFCFGVATTLAFLLFLVVLKWLVGLCFVDSRHLKKD